MSNKIVLAIPIAGQSKRFNESGYKTHKAFLDLDSSFILKKIIDQFPREIFSPIIICTNEQLIEYEKFFKLLRENFNDLKIFNINSHNLGPTYTVKQLKINKNTPIVIHYCDFLVDMNYLEIIDYLQKGLICAPFFRGFHPASLGPTTFGYMKLNPNKLLITLKEKSSFTNNKIEEPCSTGIYAFPSFKVFSELADELLNAPHLWGQKEAYTSLCLNIAVEKGYKVLCKEVNKFICLGTPRDYEEYKYWSNLINVFLSDSVDKYEFNHHIITAAGKGSRFIKFGYRLPKIFLRFHNELLIKHSLSSIKSLNKTIISLKEYKKDFENQFKDQKNLEQIYISSTPNGQLITLNKYLQNNKEINDFFVSSADYKFYLSSLKFKRFLNKFNPDIVILTTKWNQFSFEDLSNYGFVNSDMSGLIRQIIEKPNKEEVKDIDINSLLIGTFWFKSSSYIKKMINELSSEDELFIAKSINKFLDKFKVYKFDVDYWLSLGTPKELQLAEYWLDYFQN